MTRKKIFIFFFFIIFVFSLQSQPIKDIEGGENLSKLKGKNLYLLLTFRKTKIYDSLIADYVEGIKKEGFDDMSVEYFKSICIEDVKKDVERKGKRIKLKYIDKPSQAKDGYIVNINYDACIPIPAIGTRGEASVTIYPAGNPKQVMLKGNIATFDGLGAWMPRFSFPRKGREFLTKVIMFLKKIK